MDPAPMLPHADSIPVLEEDPRPSKPTQILTTPTEIRAWWLFDWANGAFFYSTMNFLPLLMTSQARNLARFELCGDCPNNEWAVDFDLKGKCTDKLLQTNATCVDGGGRWSPTIRDEAKYVNFLGYPLGYASFSQYCNTVSVILQLITFLTLGSFADYGANRKRFLIWNTIIGVTCVFIVLFFAEDNLFWLNGLFYIISVVAFSFAEIFYNAYLPLLVGSHAKVVAAIEDRASCKDITSMKRSLTSLISSRGLAAGFAGQLVYLIINLGLLFSISSESYLNTRVSIAASSIWVAIFAAISFSYLKERPGPPLPKGESYCHMSLTMAKKTLRSFQELPELGKFLIAYFVFSDGTSTLATAAAVFGQEELGMSSLEIGIALIEASIFAFVGCYLFEWLHHSRGIPGKTILIVNLFLMGLIPLYGIFFLTTPAEFYALIVIYGLNTGSQQSFTRSLYSHSIPDGRESEYFSFFELSDKGTAWLGPLVLGLVFQATGSYRDAFGTLIFFFVVGTLLLFRYNPEKAHSEKQTFTKNFPLTVQTEIHQA